MPTVSLALSLERCSIFAFNLIGFSAHLQWFYCSFAFPVALGSYLPAYPHSGLSCVYRMVAFIGSTVLALCFLPSRGILRLPHVVFVVVLCWFLCMSRGVLLRMCPSLNNSFGLFCLALFLLTVVFGRFYSVGEAGFDSPAKLAGRPCIRVPPLLGGSLKYF